MNDTDPQHKNEGMVDVLVVGGGAAGCVAAIQAARLGARTVLLEKNGVLGGTTVVAAVNFPGLFHAHGRQIIAGIGWELIQATVDRGGATLPDFERDPGKRHWEHQILVNRFVYAATLDDFCLTAGVHLRLHEMPAEATDAGDHIQLSVATKTGLETIRARTVIDATGDANIAKLLGYTCQRSEHRQPGTLVYTLAGFKLADVDFDALRRLYREALAEGRLLPTDHAAGDPPYARELSSRMGNFMHVVDLDAGSSAGRTEAEVKARQSLMRTYRFLRQVPGLEKLVVDQFANECGIRDTWRIVGETQITLEHYVGGHVWPDAMCYSFYPIDLHRHDSNQIDIRPLEAGVVPTIPYRALVPRGSRRLLVAGRCIAGDAEASSAFRVQASCMATGQVAGAAAAHVAQTGKAGVMDADHAAVRADLAAHGAIVPEAAGVPS